MACRLCHKQRENITTFDLLETEIVNFALPHINLNITKKPKICTKCEKLMKMCFFFKHNFIHHENNLQICRNKFVQSLASFSCVLKRCGYKLSDDDDNVVCRTCFRLVAKNATKILSKDFPFWQFLIITVYEGYIVHFSCDIFICDKCCRRLEKYNKFHLNTVRNEEYLSVFYKQYKEPLNKKEFLLAANRQGELLDDALFKKKARRTSLEKDTLDADFGKQKRNRKQKGAASEKKPKKSSVKQKKATVSKNLNRSPEVKSTGMEHFLIDSDESTAEKSSEANKVVPMFVDDESASDLDFKNDFPSNVVDISDESEENEAIITQDEFNKNNTGDLDCISLTSEDSENVLELTTTENSAVSNEASELYDLTGNDDANESDVVTLESSDESEIIEIDLNSCCDEKEEESLATVDDHQLALIEHSTKEHENNSTTSALKVCPMCSFNTEESRVFIKHVVDEHSSRQDLPVYTCEVCGYKSIFKYIFENHKQERHQDSDNERQNAFNTRRFNKSVAVYANDSGHFPRRHGRKPFRTHKRFSSSFDRSTSFNNEEVALNTSTSFECDSNKNSPCCKLRKFRGTRELYSKLNVANRPRIPYNSEANFNDKSDNSEHNFNKIVKSAEIILNTNTSFESDKADSNRSKKFTRKSERYNKSMKFHQTSKRYSKNYTNLNQNKKIKFDDNCDSNTANQSDSGRNSNKIVNSGEIVSNKNTLFERDKIDSNSSPRKRKRYFDKADKFNQNETNETYLKFKNSLNTDRNKETNCDSNTANQLRIPENNSECNSETNILNIGTSNENATNKQTNKNSGNSPGKKDKKNKSSCKKNNKKINKSKKKNKTENGKKNKKIKFDSRDDNNRESNNKSQNKTENNFSRQGKSKKSARENNKLNRRPNYNNNNNNNRGCVSESAMQPPVYNSSFGDYVVNTSTSPSPKIFNNFRSGEFVLKNTGTSPNPNIFNNYSSGELMLNASASVEYQNFYSYENSYRSNFNFVEPNYFS